MATVMSMGRRGGYEEEEGLVLDYAIACRGCWCALRVLSYMVLLQAHVPSSPLGRVLGFASLGASLVVGAARDNAANWLSGSGEKSKSPFLTEANAERLADALCRMRCGTGTSFPTPHGHTLRLSCCRSITIKPFCLR